MRILFLNYEYPPLGGGAGNATEYLVREFLKDEMMEMDVVVSSADGMYREEVLGERIRLYRLPIGDKRENLKKQSSKDLIVYAWRAFWLGRKLMRAKKYDGVHAFFTVPCGAVAWLLGKMFRVPYVVSLRGSDVPGYSKKYEKLYFFIRSLVRMIWRSSVSVVSNSEGLKKLAQKTDARQDVGVIYNGVDTGIFMPQPNKDVARRLACLSSSGSDSEIRMGTGVPVPYKGKFKGKEFFTILCASRLENRKGFRYAVEAVAMLRNRYSNVRLTLAGGDGNAGEGLRSLVSEKNLSDAVTFFGQYTREDLVRLQQESDVFVLPSFNEGMSNSLLEAMAGGLPVLMTPTGGAEELIIDGENGYVIAFADSKDIADKLEKVLLDPELLKHMGKKSREIAESMSWSTVAGEYRDLYKKVFVDN